ncbi:ER membrane protein complex subunit 1 isoform X2 [Halyomorpha halys]|uniref:ER membrane protein complex subunit 1 isoform X2 n=1 Tax=Halyomorpha halys TaxID=286706 RepID=UPI0006D528F5|nr:ER membrane protein complex subunit 1 isoform X2 [Halyomorpha halys]
MSIELTIMNFCVKFIFFSILICGSLALYEDQVGKFDWKKSYVGRVKYSHINSNGRDSSKLFVATENGVVAALNLHDGSIKWRRVLELAEYGVIHAFSVGSEVVTLSGSGPYLLRGWNLNSGILSYEWNIPVSEHSDIKWTMDENNLYQVRFLQNLLEVTSYNIKTGNPAGFTSTISAPWLDASSKCLLDEGTIICISENGIVTSRCLSSNALSSAKIPLSEKPLALTPIPSPYPSALMTTDSGKRMAVVVSEGSLLFLEIPMNAAAAVRKSSAGPILIQASFSDGDYELSGMILSSKHSLQEKKKTDRAQLPEGLFSSFECISDDPNLSCYFTLVGEDDSLILLNQGKVSWVREEALANIVAVEMIDLPVSDEEAAIEKEFANKEGGIVGMLYRRIHSQCLQIVNAVISILGLKEHRNQSREDLVKDQFGLHKLIIIVTKVAKIYGIENVDGDIIWQHHLKDVKLFSALESPYVPLFVQRTSRHLPYPAICTLLFEQKGTENTALYAFNPISGQALFGGLNVYNFHVKQTLLLPKENDEFIKSLLLITDDDKVEAFPPETIQEALDFHQDLFVYTSDVETGDLNGFSLVKSNQKLHAIRVWNVQLNAPVTSIAQKNKAERVHSQGRVLADRSVLYKYINPHLVAVATHTIDPVHKNMITVYLIDTVSGAVIFNAAHKRAMPPVHMVNSENWIVYSYFNDKARRTEMISLDLYEGKSMRNSTEFSSLTYLVEPIIERQAYIFPHNIMAMKETITEKGITNKHILVGVSTGSVVEIPWALLDPHRSNDVREEGVLPYTPDLTLPQEATLTYNHSLPHITGIHTSPAGLESTSLVLVYGLDLFYTRVAPSKTFDVLKDDFEYWLITAVLTGLISAAYITKKLASHKALKQAWK